MDKDILESVLKRNWKESNLEKILSVESVPAVGKNLNFLSTVNRLKIRAVLGNGRVVQKSLIMKDVSEESEFQSEFNGKYDTFRTETTMYNALTKIEHLMEEFEDTEDVLWCKMIHHIPYTCIVLEDLKAQGFEMIERVQFYGLDQSLLTAHSLGSYHGMFKALEERGLAPQNLKTWFIFDSEKMHEHMFCELTGLIEGVKRLWDVSWKPIAEKFKMTKTEVHERLLKLKELDETKFNVTNHGDCHKNNIVIKYNWDNRPIAMRFLDFQLVHYGSPCIDLTYLLHLAVEPCVRRDNFDLILKTYHDSLVNTLDKYHFKGNKPDMEEIRDGMEKYSFLGLLLSLSWHPNLLKSDQMEELRNYEKIATTDGLEGYADECFLPEPLEKKLGPDIIAFVNKFCSNK